MVTVPPRKPKVTITKTDMITIKYDYFLFYKWES